MIKISYNGRGSIVESMIGP